MILVAGAFSGTIRLPPFPQDTLGNSARSNRSRISRHHQGRMRLYFSGPVGGPGVGLAFFGGRSGSEVMNSTCWLGTLSSCSFLLILGLYAPDLMALETPQRSFSGTVRPRVPESMKTVTSHYPLHSFHYFRTLPWNGPSRGTGNTSLFFSFWRPWFFDRTTQIHFLALESVQSCNDGWIWNNRHRLFDIWYSFVILLGFWRMFGCWNFCSGSWIFLCFLGPNVMSAAWHRRNSITFKTRRESCFSFVPEKSSIACQSRSSRFMILRKFLRALFKLRQ